MRGLLIVAALAGAALACDNVRRMPAADAPPSRPDAPLPRPDAVPPRPDAAPPPPDARPGPKRTDKAHAFDTCETDADCTTYGDPCGRGIFPVNRRYESEARAKAQRACPGESMAYLTTREGLAARCVKKRCRTGGGPGAGSSPFGD